MGAGEAELAMVSEPQQCDSSDGANKEHTCDDAVEDRRDDQTELTYQSKGTNTEDVDIALPESTPHAIGQNGTPVVLYCCVPNGMPSEYRLPFTNYSGERVPAAIPPVLCALPCCTGLPPQGTYLLPNPEGYTQMPNYQHDIGSSRRMSPMSSHSVEHQMQDTMSERIINRPQGRTNKGPGRRENRVETWQEVDRRLPPPVGCVPNVVPKPWTYYGTSQNGCPPMQRTAYAPGYQANGYHFGKQRNLYPRSEDHSFCEWLLQKPNAPISRDAINQKNFGGFSRANANRRRGQNQHWIGGPGSPPRSEARAFSQRDAPLDATTTDSVGQPVTNDNNRPTPPTMMTRVKSQMSHVLARQDTSPAPGMVSPPFEFIQECLCSWNCEIETPLVNRIISRIYNEHDH